MLTYRVLAVAHILVAVPLALLATFLGITFAPFLLPFPLWLGFLGVRLWQGPSRGFRIAIRRTHIIMLALGALLCLSGITALRAAERSAAAGGGLLGAFGFIPLGAGIAIAALAIASLALLPSASIKTDQ